MRERASRMKSFTCQFASGLLPGVLLLLVVTATGCNRAADQVRREEIAAPPVEAVQARFGALPLQERLSGTVWAENQIDLYPEISGRITAVHVESGESVARSQPLVQLADQQFREQLRQAEAGQQIARARLRQAEARLAEMQAQGRRTQALGQRELVTELELETSAAQLASARADVELAEAQHEQASALVAEQEDLLRRTVVRSPIDGVVGRRDAEIGMQATPTTRLFTVGNLDHVKVRVPVTDVMLRYVREGQPVRIYVRDTGATEKVITASVTRISPFISIATRSTEAEIEVENAERLLRPGMFVPVDVLYGQSQQATLVPTSALFTDPNTGRIGVFVVEGQGPERDSAEPPADAASGPALSAPRGVEFRPVAVIARGEAEAAITPVKHGDWVVTIGQDLLSAGRTQARVRFVTWDEVMRLQGLTREALLERILRPEQAPTRAAES